KLNRFLKKELDPSSSVPDLAASRIRPYFNFGLADFDFNPSSQKAKLQAAFPSVKALLEILTKDQSYCSSISSSPLGGTVETLLGLAELNPVAFGMSADIASLNILERAELLSRFWRTASRRRPLVMLGEEYARKVTQSLEALGEPSPENPTFMSIVLRPTMASIALMRGEQIQDPFTNLMLADQVRLAEMLKFTWDIASDFLDRLKDVHSQGKLKRIIEGIAQQNQAEQAELSKRFNVKWLQSSVWVWSMLRAVAPALWDFWTKVGEGTIWQDPFLKTPPLQALSLLVKLFCDSTRLMLLVEASGSSLTERIEISAEAAGQSILSSIHDYLEGSSMPPVLAEAVNYYYDPSERFDYWAGFTSSFHKFLKQMLADLHSVNATKDYLEGLSSIISQLEILYPNRPTTEIALAEPPPNASSISQPEVVGVITEEGAQSFASLFFEKLGLPETETSFFLRMLSLLARKETERFIYKAEKVFPLLDLILPLLEHRLLLFSFPTTTSAFFDYLLQLAQRDQVEEATIESLRTRTNDYFTQLDSFAETLFDLTSQLPNLLPTDKKALTNFLQATTPVNRDMPYLLLFAGDQLVLDMCLNKADRNYQVETALSKIRAYLREQIGGKFEEPSIEIFPIGGGRIVCREDKVLLTGQNESFEFA
ncbi:MAG: hypothetical protein JNN15_20575, partial [Blastocatellia bacterium]|nr:hypothetical protein [Blastocatellia bacterium]